MKTKVLLPLSALLLSACADDTSKYSASGIGTVELNDSTFAIHYYSSTFVITDGTPHGDLRDSSRVYFYGSGILESETEDGSVYNFSINSISSDITQPIFMLDSAAQSSADTMRMYSSAEGFFAQNVHITRDWRRNDYLDATGIYPGSNDGEGDIFGFFADTTTLGADTVKMWLRLCRQNTDTLQMITRHISTPVNCLRDSTRERIVVNLKRIDAYGDTVNTNLVYSYVNWIE